MNKPKLLFTFNYGEENLKKASELGYELTFIPENELTSEHFTTPFEIIVCFNPFQNLSYSMLQSVRWIQLVSKGISHVPQEIVQSENIRITNNAKATSVPIAELIISYLLQLYKQAPLFYRQKEVKKWAANQDILEVSGKTIGFLGTGNIASEAAKRLKAFDAVILGLNHLGHAANYFDQVFPLSELETFLPKCDVVVSTLPQTPDTYHLLNGHTLSLLKRGSCIINVSRGSVIDEAALISKLQEHHFLGAALDVFEQEPLDLNSPLWSLDNVIITPHNALYSDQYNTRVFEMIYENLKRYRDKKELINPVDFNRGY